MIQEFIPYEQALALKELGFDFEDYDILGFYSKKYGVTTHSQLTKNDEYNPAPLYQQAFRWFREKHNLFGFVSFQLEPCKESGCGEFFEHIFYIFKLNELRENNQNVLPYINEGMQDFYNYEEKPYTYEEAELACLIKLIEIVKEK
jgi:hypothetical protein